jgi:DNA mismatch repair protein MutL
MPKVLVLPDHIASQIAAGEVIERPSSVVKELVENSIDAGATQIEISINSECRDIRIADNGCGMEPEDAVLAFQRHATSKIVSADDLWSLRTMGFRGEALPSIASVAKVTCYTRTAEAPNGVKIETADGNLTSVETGCAPGTVMEINDLFYNVPARMKFMKKQSTELAHIHETIQSLAVAFPKITFQLINAGEVVLRTTGSGKLQQAMQEAGILNGGEELCQVTYAELKNGMVVYGYVAKPTHFRGDRKGILSIVNNRPVRCPVTYKALERAYSDLLPNGKHPIAVLTITADPKHIDVNVHPTKKEVKYSHGDDVFQAVKRAVVEAVRMPQLTPAPAGESEGSEAPPANGDATAGSGTTSSSTQTSAAPSAPGVAEAPKPWSPRTTQQMRIPERLGTPPPQSRVTGQIPLRSRPTLPDGWRLMGYLHNTYIFFETPEGLEIVEQHIAHERTIYERVLAAQDTPGRISDNVQRLVISVPLNLTPEQRSVVQNNLSALQSVGFDFEIKESSVLCTQVPLELAHKEYATIVQQMIDEVSTTEQAEMHLEATKSIACQAAIKNGMPLTEADIVVLVHDWYKTQRNDTCPHGRPVRLKFSMDKLFQLFHPA